ncbi:MAG: PolC-type DNA polymerase III, partial [Clostridiales bacterium]|nr:PolC-type DNA polymerase III [Clostridiales bacterium]
AGKPAGPKLIMGRPINDPAIDMSELTQDSGRVTLKGEVISCERRTLKNDTTVLHSFVLTDFTSSVYCKAFVKVKGDDNGAAADDAIAAGAWLKVRGRYAYDGFQREMVLMVEDISRETPAVREDRAERKRVELHLHTQMSTMDAVASPTQLIEQAARWGHPAIAITDHGVLQAFPEAFAAAQKQGVKLIPGCEAYLIDDMAQVVERADGRELADAAFVVLDVETTGLNPALDQIIEIGAVRFEKGVEVAEFSQLIHPQRPIPPDSTKIHHITDAMVRGMPAIGEVIGRFADFCRGAVLVAHNAAFDMAFFSRAFGQAGLPFDHPKLDTLTLMRNAYPGQRSYKLGNLCKLLGIRLDNAHRAVHDERATAQMQTTALAKLAGERDARRLNQLNGLFAGDAAGKSHHIILLAASQDGLVNLNRLVSEAHLTYFHRVPRMPRGLIQKYREGLIVGSACSAGELFSAMLAGADEAALSRIAKFYDYLEVQPIDNNRYLVRGGAAADDEALRTFNRRIVALGERLGIPVVATGDVHFKEPRDAIFRAILMNAKGFEDSDQQAELYFRTTDEMLDEFSYLGKDKAIELVVDNPAAIAERVQPMRIFIRHPEDKETFQPFWPDAEDEIRGLTWGRARALYGDPLPEIVQARLNKELGAICGYGFSTLYDIAVKLTAKSRADGYIVGSRGSVGSSLVAYMTGITEVNSLPPHYACPKCLNSEFDVPPGYACGPDLPAKTCPKCGANMGREGYNIPFEVFLGFKGDKVPDIDLNFSGVYQPVAHAYVKELFGAENVFRAGTIGTVAEKTAFGYVLKYLEARGIENVGTAEKERLAAGVTGAKRTTGQHPAGMVVLPKGYEIYQFTAIQHPADDQSTDVITTHFDFASMHDVLVKLDILGHDDPTMLRNLQELTGIAPDDVPLDDPAIFGRILSLFQSPEALGVSEGDIGCPTGTLGVPEFGTTFVRGMLMDTRPSTMEELIRISGLSHGTNVWLGNTQDIIKKGLAKLTECICTRDDIMNQLIALGAQSKMAFDIMESVRKGKGLRPEMEQAMRDCRTPEWFIESCKKIEYMFPKSHAVAYVLMALRIAYFKIYHPEAYYACYLKRNLGKVDASRMVTTIEHLRNWLDELRDLPKEERDKEEDTISILESLIEMHAR